MMVVMMVMMMVLFAHMAHGDVGRAEGVRIGVSSFAHGCAHGLCSVHTK